MSEAARTGYLTFAIFLLAPVAVVLLIHLLELFKDKPK
jgi:hypothetical protein